MELISLLLLVVYSKYIQGIEPKNSLTISICIYHLPNFCIDRHRTQKLLTENVRTSLIEIRKSKEFVLINF